MSRKAFEAVMQKYEGVKESLQKKWESFKNKFEGTKSEMSQEVMKAETPEELIALGKRLQEKGETLKVERDGIENEESQEDTSYENKKQEATNEARSSVFEGSEHIEEAKKMNEAFDKEKAEKAALEEARIAAEEKKIAEDDAAKREEILAKINDGGAESSAVKEIAEPKIESGEQPFENEPLSPVMQKYEKNIEDIISQYKQLKAQAEELRRQGDDKEAYEFEHKANYKSAEIFQGGGETYDESFIEITHRRQGAGETYKEFEEKRHAPVAEYRKALYDSPKTLLKIASETGNLDWQKISGRLLRDKDFIEAISKTNVSKDPYFQVALRDNMFEFYANNSDRRQY